MKKIKYPEYFHIGLPKTGTTSIQYVLEKDPRVNLIFKSGFFNTIKYWTSEFDRYDDQKMVNIESDETIVRHFPIYGKFPLSLAHIAQKAPQAQIIITIREQRKLMESRYKDALNTVYYDGTFHDWLVAPQGLDFISFCQFSLLYKLVNLFFAKKQIHFLFFEELKYEPEAFYGKLYQIFNIEPPNDIPFSTHKNKSLGKSDLEVLRRANKYLGLSTKKNYSKNLRNFAYPLFRLSTSQKSIDQGILWTKGQLYENLERDFEASNQELISRGILSEATLKKYNYLC